MGVGIFLIIVGAILAFAVRADSDVVDIQMVGLILIFGGLAAIWHSRRGNTVEREVTRVEDLTNPAKPVRTIRESRTRQDPDY